MAKMFLEPLIIALVFVSKIDFTKGVLTLAIANIFLIKRLNNFGYTFCKCH
jgi:hypothetical protein